MKQLLLQGVVLLFLLRQVHAQVISDQGLSEDLIAATAEFSNSSTGTLANDYTSGPLIPTAAVPQQATTTECKVPGLVKRGCDACSEKVKCKRCLPGWDLILKNTNCLKNRCCNQRPTVPKVSVQNVRMQVDKLVYIDCSKGVTDDTTSSNKLVYKMDAYPAKFGRGNFVQGSGVYSYRPKLPQAPNTKFTMTYSVKDQEGGVSKGSVIIQFTDTSRPTLKQRATLHTLTAGVTAAYPAKDILTLLDAKDPEGNPVKIAAMKLMFPNRGDKLAQVTSTGAWTYYCPSAAPCAQYVGNEIQVNVTNGVGVASGRLVQPVKPRPDLSVSKPYQLTPNDDLDTVHNVGVGSLEKLGFSLAYATLPQDTEPGEVLENNLLPVELDPASNKMDAIEFYPDINSDSVAETMTLPVAVADVAPFASLLGIVNMAAGAKATAAAAEGTGGVIAASNQHSYAAAAQAQYAARQATRSRIAAAMQRYQEQQQQQQDPEPYQSPGFVTTALLSAEAKPAVDSCYGCLIDDSGNCGPSPTDPAGESCSSSCVLGATGKCEIEGSDSCASCALDSFGDCADSTGAPCPGCVPDDTGMYCITDPQGGGGGGGSNAVDSHAWLVPPTKTTAMGFWVSLGCSTAGNITVEFDAADDEDFDGNDADNDTNDMDRDVDPRRDVVGAGRRRAGRRRLLGALKASVTDTPQAGQPKKLTYAQLLLSQASDGSNTRGLNQGNDNRAYNGKGANGCYTDDYVDSGSGRAYKTIIVNGQTGTTLANKQYVADVSLDITRTATPQGTQATTGARRKLLARNERELEAPRNYCKYYAQATSIPGDSFECIAGSEQLVGVWFSAYIQNSSGYIRQVRLQVEVPPGADPSLYVGTIAISQSRPFDSNDPLLGEGTG